jgi:hypothetical protein
MASQDLLDLLPNLVQRTVVRHRGIEVGWKRPMAPVMHTARNFVVGLSTEGAQRCRRMIDEPGPRSKASSSTWTIMWPFST